MPSSRTLPAKQLCPNCHQRPLEKGRDGEYFRRCLSCTPECPTCRGPLRFDKSNRRYYSQCYQCQTAGKPLPRNASHGTKNYAKIPKVQHKPKAAQYSNPHMTSSQKTLPRESSKSAQSRTKS